MLEEILRKSAQEGGWASWVASDRGDAAVVTRDFLNHCFSNIPPETRSRLSTRIKNGDSFEIDAAIHELVAHELFRRMHLALEFQPRIGSQTPDLSFVVFGKKFLADVYSAHSPRKTIKNSDDGTGEAWDTSVPGESRAKKIADVIQSKALTYKETGLPLVIIVFLGDHYLLSATDVERALFGLTIDEIALEREFPRSVPEYRVPIGGLLLPDEYCDPRHVNLSAVVACDWFDTLNQQDRGKRLHCSVLHNYLCDTAFPLEAFVEFPQVVWQQAEPGTYQPRYTVDRNIVAKFATGDDMEFGRYTSNNPW